MHKFWIVVDNPNLLFSCYYGNTTAASVSMYPLFGQSVSGPSQVRGGNTLLNCKWAVTEMETAWDNVVAQT